MHRRRSRRVVFTALAVMASLVAGLLAESQPAAADGPSLPTAPRQDIASMRTRYGKTFATDTPGVYESVIHAKPIHYVAGDGTWKDIDTTLVPSPDGSFRTAA